MSRTLLYVAYPMRLDLSAANAVQTYNTVRELRSILPGTRLVVPRWLREKSAFSDLDTLHLPRPAVNKLSRLIRWAGWSYVERTLYSFMLGALLLIWRLTARGYRVLYVRDAVCAAWLGCFRRVHGAAVIYEVHDLEASHPSKASRWPGAVWKRILPWIDRSALTRADRIVSLTETFRHWAVTRRVSLAENITVIPDAYDPTHYRPMDKQAARAKLGLPPEAFIVGYGGLTFAYRRLDLLVRAFAALPYSGSKVLLLVGGRPDEVAELRALAGHLSLPDESVITPGQVSSADNAKYLSAADVLVIPDTVTDITASPLKLFEYMALGRAIVAKDMPALREILDDNSALFFPPGDAEALCDALRTLSEDAQLARRLGDAAQTRSHTYTYRARAERILEVVQQCL